MSGFSNVIGGRILRGSLVANKILENCAKRVSILCSAGAARPGLAMVIVGNNPASEKYVSLKHTACLKVGLYSKLTRLPDNISEKYFITEIERLNADARIHGILVQQPLPSQIRVDVALRTVLPSKDVDGFHPDNLGALACGSNNVLSACTPKGCMYLLKYAGINLTGKKVTIIGRSLIVGKPLTLMMINAGATVTVCNRSTPPDELHTSCLRADVLIAAAGHPKLVTEHMVKPGATVLDVGINHDDNGNLCGDVDFTMVKKIAGLITPVPGGVGPMTVAMLIENTVEIAERLTAKTN